MTTEGIPYAKGLIGIGCGAIVYQLTLRSTALVDYSVDDMLIPSDGTAVFVAPGVASILYLIMVFSAEAPSQRPVPSWVLTLFKYWNFGLALMSIIMVVNISSNLIGIAGSFGEYLCGSTTRGLLMFWMEIFAYSKYLELLDTAFLIAKGSKVRFLHWFHHVTVLNFTWLAVYSEYLAGTMFSLVNAAVHTVMYWYYYRRSCGAKPSYAKYITKVQILQMVFGCAWTLLFICRHLLDPHSCPGPRNTPIVIAYAILMYGSYLFLFAKFYIDRYLHSRVAQAKKSS